MASTNPLHKVYWYEGFSPNPHRLVSDQIVDVAIVGGGIAGLMCAKRLIELKPETKIAIVEATWCGGGASGKSSGFITPDSELEFSNFLNDFDLETAKILWEFGRGGVKAIADTIKAYDLDCDYQVQNSLFIARNPRAYKKKVISEYEAQKKGNYTPKLHTRENVRSVIGTNVYHGAVEYNETFGMNALKFCQGLKDVLMNKGIKIFEESPVMEIKKGEVFANGHRLLAEKIVVATDHFLPSLGIAAKEVYHAQTFLSISKPLSEASIKKMFPDGPKMVWDTDLIYQYYRLTGDNRLLLGASNVLYTYLPNEKRPTPQRVIRKMNRYLKHVFPDVPVEIEYVWPGLIGVSKDFAPIAGEHTEITGLYFIGGAAGLPWATALGMYTAEKIAGTSTQNLDRFFTPKRNFPIGSFIQKIISKPLAFAISHGIRKYFS